MSDFECCKSRELVYIDSISSGKKGHVHWCNSCGSLHFSKTKLTGFTEAWVVGNLILTKGDDCDTMAAN